MSDFGFDNAGIHDDHGAHVNSHNSRGGLYFKVIKTKKRKAVFLHHFLKKTCLKNMLLIFLALS